MRINWFPAFVITLSLLLASCDQQKSAEDYIKSGNAYVDKGDWKSAIIEFKNAVKQSPQNSAVRAKLGLAYIQAGSDNAAIKELERAIELGYDKSELLVPLGKAYRQTNQFAKIIEEIKAQDNYSPNIQARILALRAAALFQMDKHREAQAALNKAKQLDNSATEVRLEWASFEGRNGNTEAQKTWLKPLLERDGGVADAWSQMGQIESAANNIEAAEAAYTRAIESRQMIHFDYARRALVRIASKNFEGAKADVDILKKAGANWPIVGHAEGLIAFQQQKIDRARALFQKVLAKTPDFTPSQHMLALIYFNDQSYQSAVNLLEQYNAVDPNNVVVNLIYASSLLQLNQLAKAIPILDRLQRNNPDDYRVLAMLGEAYLRQRKSDEAIKVLQKAVALKPDQASSRLQLGVTLLTDSSTLAKGQQELLTAIELDPNLIQAELSLFESYLQQKRFADAQVLAANLNKKNPDSSQGANLIALAYLAEEKKQQALEQLQATLERFPADFLTANNLARIYLQDNDLEKAKSLYESVVENEPAHLGALNQLAAIAAREKNRDQMMLRLRQAQERNPDVLAARIILASQYLQQNDTNKAMQLLIDVKPEEKTLPAYIMLMAQARLKVDGQQQHAMRSLESLAKSNPEIPAVHFLLAQGYSLDGRLAEMRESLQKTIDLVPNHLGANVVFARLELFEGKIDAFKKRVAFLDKTYPNSPDVQFLKAKVASGDHNYDGAIGTLSSLMAQTPNSDVIIDLSKNQWQSGDRQGAISELELWVQENKNDSQAMMLLAQFYLADNRDNEARATYQTLAQQAGDNPMVLNNLAWLLKDTDPAQGIKYALNALALRPESAAIEDTLAMLYLANGESAKALEHSEKAAKAMPDFTEIQFNYVKALIANNQKAKAKSVLTGLYEKSTSNEAKRLIRKELDKL